MQSFSQAILPGLIQRLRDAGLTKAPRTPGLQDFLRIMSTGRCTWDHLLCENCRNYKLCIMRIKFISRCPGQGRKVGPWFIKYPCGRDPLTGKIKYKIEKVGEFKKLAERAYQKKMVEWAEKKYLDIREESTRTFSQLVLWFLELPVVRQNKTIKDIVRSCRDLDKVFGPMLIREIKPGMVEKYQHQRLQEPTRYGNPRSAANANRTIAVLKPRFNLAVREELADKNPGWKVKMLPENNAWDRILSVEELERLPRYLPPHAARIVHFAYLTGMRAGKIFNRTWDKVDLAQELVRLGRRIRKPQSHGLSSFAGGLMIY